MIRKKKSLPTNYLSEKFVLISYTIKKKIIIEIYAAINYRFRYKINIYMENLNKISNIKVVKKCTK